MEKFFQEAYDLLLRILPNILLFTSIIVIGVLAVRIVVRLLKNIFTRAGTEHSVATFVVSLLRVIMYLIVSVTALASVGVNVTSLITAIGAAVLTAGLALQDSLSNLVSGLVLIFNKPFVAGDILEFQDIKGRVESIKIFFTTIKTFDNKLVTIPNSSLTKNNVVNCTMVDKRRVDLSYTISYDDDISKVKALIYSLISTDKRILNEPEPSVYVGKHLDHGIEIVVWVWVATDDYYDVFYFMQENVKRVFDENSITIPFPHIVVKNDK